MPGITVTHATKEVSINGNSLSDAYDNLKVRQASTADIEAGVKGYMCYYDYKLLMSEDGTIYTGLGDWTYTNILTNESGVFRAGIIVYNTPGTYSQSLYNATIEFTSAGTYDMRQAEFTGTIALVNTSGGSVTAQLHPDHNYFNAGPDITIEASAAITVAVNGCVNGSRVQLYNVDTDTELFNDTTTGSESLNLTYEAPETIRLRVTYVNGLNAKVWYEVTGLTSATGLAFNVNQVTNDVYEGNNVDGSTVTECSVSGTTIRIYVDDADGETNFQRIYAWYQYYLTTEAGIREQDGTYLVALTQTLYRFNDTMSIVNQSTSPLRITGANVESESGTVTDVFDHITSSGNIYAVPPIVVPFRYTTTGEAVAIDQTDLNTLLAKPTASQIRTEIDSNSTKLASILEDTGTTIPGQISGLETGGATAEEIRQEMDANSTKLASILEDTGTTIPSQISGISGGLTTEEHDQLMAIPSVDDGMTPGEFLALK